MKKGFAVAVLAFVLVAFPAFAAEEKVLNVFNWSEYVPQDVLDQFTKETGIKVVYTTFDSNEAMYAKLKLLRGTGYDLVVPSAYFIELLHKDGLLSKIDQKKLDNLHKLDPTVMHQAFDPENAISIPYMWGLTGMLVNKKYVNPDEITSWNDLKRPEFKGRVLLSDDVRDCFTIALKSLGYSLNTTNEAEIKAAYEWLRELKPSVRVFDITATKQAFISEEVIAGISWNGDAYIAMQENPNLVFIYPKDGIPLWLDSFVISSAAAHPENAHAFINFLLRPEIAKRCVTEYSYTSPNLGVKSLLDPEMAQSNVIYPTPENLKNSEFTLDVGSALPIYDKYWELFKTAS